MFHTSEKPKHALFQFMSLSMSDGKARINFFCAFHGKAGVPISMKSFFFVLHICDVLGELISKQQITCADYTTRGD